MADKKPITAPVCPYCKATSKLADSIVIYKQKSYGMVWLCSNYPKCDSFIGTHPDNRPLGRMANKELRTARKQAHLHFDTLWRGKMQRDGVSQKDARIGAYAWLAGKLGVQTKDCHIGFMDVAGCRRVSAICEPYYRKIISSEWKSAPAKN